MHLKLVFLTPEIQLISQCMQIYVTVTLNKDHIFIIHACTAAGCRGSDIGGPSDLPSVQARPGSRVHVRAGGEHRGFGLLIIPSSNHARVVGRRGQCRR